MLEVIDLTLPIPETELETVAPSAPFETVRTIETCLWNIRQGGSEYQARVHKLHHWGMAGTYIDFPGHILATDDGCRADTVPLDRLFRLPASVIHLDRADGSGMIDVPELRDALALPLDTPAVIINALGPRQFDEIEERSVYLSIDVARWLADAGVRLLVSDVYESNSAPQGLFPALFARGIHTVCCPTNLHAIRAHRVRLSALPLRQAGATQLPCRLVAEQEIDE
ncbi:MAG: hypothetical protein HN742_14820 [Lentisphaerae bacterium]|jgi:kynurenine formamidase|nr:hypothetical protein [Lentisphaerota bacterium]MBT4818625.1 hypothetical protein [Lentisphaerota bacterium]MBT5609535.1 hypothetical protein [Lentisphaerota bacterium]MBT7058441.1 hypothetical protein [Lentisphaerota bacterium]MBT7843150.1 hypothetical protein [Lentisphaerota bacterium]